MGNVALYAGSNPNTLIVDFGFNGLANNSATSVLYLDQTGGNTLTLALEAADIL